METIKQWYLKTYPDDELGRELTDNAITSVDVYEMLKDGYDIYDDILQVDDSLIRERVFEKVSDDLHIPYDDIYELLFNN